MQIDAVEPGRLPEVRPVEQSAARRRLSLHGQPLPQPYHLRRSERFRA